eukprot:501835-Pyramimonas_sp.AAC.1
MRSISGGGGRGGSSLVILCPQDAARDTAWRATRASAGRGPGRQVGGPAAAATAALRPSPPSGA